MLQVYNFFIFIVLGIIIAFVFDIFRILRKAFKTSNVITYIEDILFWIIAGFLIMISIFRFNNGELRFYLFIGLSIGILIYILLLTKLVNNVLLKLLMPIKKVLYIFLSILKKFYNLIVNILKKCKNKSKKTIQKNNYNV